MLCLSMLSTLMKACKEMYSTLYYDEMLRITLITLALVLGGGKYLNSSLKLVESLILYMEDRLQRTRTARTHR